MNFSKSPQISLIYTRNFTKNIKSEVFNSPKIKKSIISKFSPELVGRNNLKGRNKFLNYMEYYMEHPSDSKNSYISQGISCFLPNLQEFMIMQEKSFLKQVERGIIDDIDNYCNYKKINFEGSNKIIKAIDSTLYKIISEIKNQIGQDYGPVYEPSSYVFRSYFNNYGNSRECSEYVFDNLEIYVYIPPNILNEYLMKDYNNFMAHSTNKEISFFELKKIKFLTGSYKNNEIWFLPYFKPMKNKNFGINYNIVSNYTNFKESLMYSNNEIENFCEIKGEVFDSVPDCLKPIKVILNGDEEI